MRVQGLACLGLRGLSSILCFEVPWYPIKSKRLEGGHIRDYVGEYYRGY